ncbi:substrate-binding domain-containing protein [Nostoc flagelliforme FACHB-838]|uniref:Substrate-binding domain-containing protein n=1 Tax=Nostoc flagelliforme FACHB-838 TaxID=2692904 RepID=A0ABR8DN28_9NOSO|nr:substrate-binding domain-containing protein [Nostoc flagelliforme]MBD2529934.1 substrate-binding domain-containing protein [Nostoc flagelliforme FACHB-838]
MVNKVALLIGVSEYEPDLNPLPGSVKDVDAMQRVLVNPEMGDFAEADITVLKNPQRQEMENAIHRLYADRHRDDLVLFYFSGHGIKDERGNLYLSTRITRKENGKLVKPSAVAASFLHECINDCRSQRQVIILDCCFSGAIAQGMTVRDDGIVNVQEQLGGKGRAILTSSTSTQYSFAPEGFELSIYTRYLVEGIETGAADHDEDGWISVGGLHDYASIKVQEAAPAMTPKFYPVEEGYKINLARAPVGDCKLMYRRKVEEIARKKQGKISDINHRTLKELSHSLNLPSEEANAIEAEVLQPYVIREEKLQRYEQALSEAIERQNPLSDEDWIDLGGLQQILRLRDEDVAPIKELFQDKNQARQPPEDENSSNKQTSSSTPTSHQKTPSESLFSRWKLLVFGLVSVSLGVGINQIWLNQGQLPETPFSYSVRDSNDRFTEVKDADVPSGTFNYGLSTTWAPIRGAVDNEIQKAFPNFKLKYVDFTLEETGSLTSIEKLLDKSIAFAQYSYPLTEQQQKNFKEIPIANDGVAIAVNPKLNVTRLTLDQLKGIYTGKITNWNQLGGPDLEIKPLSRNVIGGTVKFFKEKVLGDPEYSFSPQLVKAVQSTTLGLREVSREKGSIYFASASEIIGQCMVKPLWLGKDTNHLIPPYQKSSEEKTSECPENPNKFYKVNVNALSDQSYPLTRKLYIVVKLDGSIDQKAGEAYAKLLLTPRGQDLIEEAGFGRISK